MIGIHGTRIMMTRIDLITVPIMRMGHLNVMMMMVVVIGGGSSSGDYGIRIRIGIVVVVDGMVVVVVVVLHHWWLRL